jgi:hypothetical protein
MTMQDRDGIIICDCDVCEIGCHNDPVCVCITTCALFSNGCHECTCHPDGKCKSFKKKMNCEVVHA